MTGAAILAPALLALGAAFCFALALILTQYGLRTVPPGARRSTPSAAPWWRPGWRALLFVDWRGFDWRAALIFAGVGCVFPVVVSILSVRSNERLGPAVAGAAGNITPLFAVLFAVLFLGERIGLGPGRGPGPGGRRRRPDGVARRRRRPAVADLGPGPAARRRPGARRRPARHQGGPRDLARTAGCGSHRLFAVDGGDPVAGRPPRARRRPSRPHRPAVVHRRWPGQRHGDLSSLCGAWLGLDRRGGAAGRASSR